MGSAHRRSVAMGFVETSLRGLGILNRIVEGRDEKGEYLHYVISRLHLTRYSSVHTQNGISNETRERKMSEDFVESLEDLQ